MGIRRPRPLTAIQQLIGLQRSLICRGQGTVRLGRLIWEFETRPTPLSRVYGVRVTYTQDATPRVLVIRPDLVDLAGGRKLPHVYEQRPTRLCLYLPRAREWNTSLSIPETIVPWAILWLFTSKSGSSLTTGKAAACIRRCFVSSARRILAIDGGGIKGALPIGFLARVEEVTGERIVDHFDFIAGTSTGGIIAIGLGLGLPASDVLAFYRNDGAEVFGDIATAARARWRDRLLAPIRK